MSAAAAARRRKQKRDPTHGAQIAPLAHGRVKCGTCDHAPGLHYDYRCWGSNETCDCEGYVEVNG